MPTSTFSGIATLVHYLDRIRPQSVLDIGVGFGKMGFIVREYIDVMNGERHLKEEWQVILEGIEVFPEYIQDHQRFLYDRIHTGDAYEVIDGLGTFDVVILGDVLEHFEKEQAFQMLDKCINHCRRALILFLPLGPGWTQGEVHGNPHEEHLSFWERSDIEPFADQAQYSNCRTVGDYGRFLILREDYQHHRMREKAERMFQSGQCAPAIAYLKESLPHLPKNLDSEYLLVDFLLNDRRIEEAAGRLRHIGQDFPQEHATIHTYLAKLDKFLTTTKPGPV